MSHYDELGTQSDRLTVGELKAILNQVPDDFFITLGWGGLFTIPDEHEIEVDVEPETIWGGTVTIQCDGDADSVGD